MTQSDTGVVREIITLAQSSTIVQVGIAISAIGASLYFVRSATKKLLGNGDESTEKTRLALDALSKVNDAQAKLIELYQQHEASFDETEPSRKVKTKPIDNETLDQLNDNE